MKKLTLLFIFVLTAINASAEVRLLVDDNIKVIAINGQEIRHGMLQPSQKEFKLHSGRHAITARYDRMFDLPRGEHDHLKSGNMTLTANLKDNQTYQLVMPNQPNAYATAKTFAKTPVLALSQHGQILTQQHLIDEQPSILGNITHGIGNLLGRGEYGSSSHDQPISALDDTSTLTPNTPKITNNLDEFMRIWLNANQEEREKIRQWINH
ncbi:DUF2057 family protein [Moraxella oculi]|uniref:DUF2057 family protein n=1 Tax=Moraxella oculi TaxID=2940516 RepID=A0ABW8UB18_9GAMM